MNIEALEGIPKPQARYMSDFQKPVQRSDTSHIEQPSAIPPIEKDKKKEDMPPNDAWKDAVNRPFLFATLFSHLKKLIAAFSGKNRSLAFGPTQQKLINDLLEFYRLLVVLSHEDHSHDPQYLEQMSELWHTLIHDCNPIDPSERKNLESYSLIKNLINSISSYPPQEDHSLGYYLTEHAGSEWIPFPFMKLLQKLHEEHQNQPMTSFLTGWIRQCEDIFEDLGIQP